MVNLIYIASCPLKDFIISGISHCQIALNMRVWFNKSIFSPGFHFRIIFDIKIAYVYIVKVGAELIVRRSKIRSNMGKRARQRVLLEGYATS